MIRWSLLRSSGAVIVFPVAAAAGGRRFFAFRSFFCGLAAFSRAHHSSYQSIFAFLLLSSFCWLAPRHSAAHKTSHYHKHEMTVLMAAVVPRDRALIATKMSSPCQLPKSGHAWCSQTKSKRTDAEFSIIIVGCALHFFLVFQKRVGGGRKAASPQYNRLVPLVRASQSTHH